MKIKDLVRDLRQLPPNAEVLFNMKIANEQTRSIWIFTNDIPEDEDNPTDEPKKVKIGF